MRVAQGEFRELVEAHQARVFSIAYRMLGDRGAAEEVAQDVFLELHRSLGKLDSIEHVLAWLRRVAVHRSADALRRRAIRVDFAAQEFRDEGNWLAAAMPVCEGESPLSRRVEQLIGTLPSALRSVILLRYQEDLLPDEIAATLSMPVATVKSNLQRALQLLRAKAECTLKEYTRGREHTRGRA